MTSKGERGSTVAFRILTILLLAGLAPAVVALLYPPSGKIPWDLVICTILAGARYGWIALGPDRRIHELIVWLYIYLFLGVAPLVQDALMVTPETTPNVDPEFRELAGIVTLLGVMAFWIGSVLAKGSRKNHHEPRKSQRLVSLPRVLLLAGLALVAATYYLLKVGPATVLLSRTELGMARNALWPDTSIRGIIIAVVTMTTLVAALGLIQVIRQGSGGVGLHCAAVGLALLALVVSNPISSPRYIAGTVVGALAIGLGALTNRHRYHFLAIGMIGGFLILFPLLDTFRYSIAADMTIENPLSALTSGDFDSFAQIVNSVEYVSHEGISWGYQLLGVLLFWVPRKIWSEKPMDTGVLIAEYKDYHFTNLSSPLWAEFYVNGGVVLLVIGMFAVGWMIRRADLQGEAFLTRLGMPSVFGSVLPFYMIILLRGSLLQAMAFLFVLAGSSWFIQARVPRSVVRRGNF